MERELDKRPQSNRRSQAGRCFARLVTTAVLAGGSVLGDVLPQVTQFRKDVHPILEEYCYDCHADGAKKGGLAFDEFKSDAALLHPDLWFAVLKNTRSGLMPPQNKPLPEEIRQCNTYLREELSLQPAGSVLLALGLIAHNAVLRALALKPSLFTFAHGAEHALPGSTVLLDSYHCSRYNTQTRRLTEQMFHTVFARAAVLVRGR